jgi:hypothetical protein
MAIATLPEPSPPQAPCFGSNFFFGSSAGAGLAFLPAREARHDEALALDELEAASDVGRQLVDGRLVGHVAFEERLAVTVLHHRALLAVLPSSDTEPSPSEAIECEEVCAPLPKLKENECDEDDAPERARSSSTVGMRERAPGLRHEARAHLLDLTQQLIGQRRARGDARDGRGRASGASVAADRAGIARTLAKDAFRRPSAPRRGRA